MTNTIATQCPDTSLRIATFRRVRSITPAVMILLTPCIALAQSTLKDTVKTVGQNLASRVRISIPFTARSRITIMNGDMNGKVLPVVAGANLSIPEEVDVSEAKGKRRKMHKEKELVPVVLAPGEQVTLVVSNQTRATETVSIILKYYNDQNKFAGASRPKDFFIPPAPSSTSDTWVFRGADLRTD